MVYKESSDWIQQPHDTKRSDFSGRGFLQGILIFTGKEINGFPPDSVPISGHLRLADGSNPKRASHSLFILASTLVCYLGVRQCDNGWETAAYGQSTPGDKNITCGTCRSSLHNNCLRCLLHKPAVHHSVFLSLKKRQYKKIKEWSGATFIFTSEQGWTERLMIGFCLRSWAGQAGLYLWKVNVWLNIIVVEGCWFSWLR